jgi:hypothetical protein
MLAVTGRTDGWLRLGPLVHDEEPPFTGDPRLVYPQPPTTGWVRDVDLRAIPKPWHEGVYFVPVFSPGLTPMLLISTATCWAEFFVEGAAATEDVDAAVAYVESVGAVRQHSSGQGHLSTSCIGSGSAARPSTLPVSRAQPAARAGAVGRGVSHGDLVPAPLKRNPLAPQHVDCPLAPRLYFG